MIKWGIIGLGNIVMCFANSLSYTNKGKLYDIASKAKDYIEIPTYNRLEKVVVNLNNWESYGFERKLEFDDMYAEIKEVHDCLKGLKLESECLSLNESIRIMNTLDKIKKYHK